GTPVLEIVIRGTIVYLVLFMLFRFIVKRQTGGLGISDLLVIVLIADAVQNAMAGEYKSITDGLILAGTIIFWNVTLDWLAFHFPAVRRYISPPPLLLVKNGRAIRQ